MEVNNISFFVYRGPRDFIFIYVWFDEIAFFWGPRLLFFKISMEVHEISFLFIWRSTRLYFYLYGGLRDIIFVYMVVYDISFLFILGSTKFQYYLYWGPRNFIFIYVGYTRFLSYLYGGPRDFIFIYMEVHDIDPEIGWILAYKIWKPLVCGYRNTMGVNRPAGVKVFCSCNESIFSQMFNIILMRKESVNYKCKLTFNSWIIF